MKTGVTCADVMTTKPITVSERTSIPEVARIMKKNHVGAVLVAEDGLIKGVLTEQDIVRKLVAQDKDPLNAIVSDISSKKVHSITPGKDIFEALMVMRDHNIRHVPIVEDGGKLAGLVTAKDILKIEPDLFELLAEKIELREEERKLRDIEGSF